MFRTPVLVALVMMLVSFLFVFVAFAAVVVSLFASGPVAMPMMVGICGY